MLLIFDVMGKILTILDLAASFHTRVSNCTLSSLGQFLILLHRYTFFTYSIDGAFKLRLHRVNFVTVLNHSLYVSLILIALTTDVISTIQRLHLGVMIHHPCLHQIITEMMFSILSKRRIWKC